MKKMFILSILFMSTGSMLWAQDYPDITKPASNGYYNLSQLSFLIGKINYIGRPEHEMHPSVTNINGYRFNEHISMGIGVGMTVLSYAIFPVFADFRATLFKSNLSPVLAFKGGYSFVDKKKEMQGIFQESGANNKGGLMINPEIGFKLPLMERADFMLTFGYWHQHLETENKYNGNSYISKVNFNQLSFTINFLFKL